MDSAPKAPRAQKSVNARAFALGGGVTTALVAAAVVAFLSIAAFVAFEGMPFASGDSPESSVSLESGAPQAAALAASTTADSVAADPSTPSAAALAELAAALPPGAAGAPGGGSSPSGDDPGPGPGDSGPGPGPGPDPDPPPPPPPGLVQGTVGSVDEAAGSLGLDLPLSETTDQITRPLDDAVGGAINDVGDGLGPGNLGDKANKTVGGLTHGLLD